MWSVADIADALIDGLARAEARLTEEHAVYGLDALDELGLHPMIEQAFREAGFGVHREQRYPADRVLARFSEGQRCDFVLTPDRRGLREPDRPPTLFDPPDAVPLDEAFWLEIKTARQFTTDGPNPRYTTEMLSVSRADVSKLSRDRHILHAGLGLAAFVEDQRVADNDLKVWYERAVARGLPIGFPSMRLTPISNRLGNGLCAIAICPVNHL